jgi:hypothetical protein
MFVSIGHIAVHGALSKAGRAQNGNGAIGTPANETGMDRTDENDNKSIEDVPYHPGYEPKESSIPAQ